MSDVAPRRVMRSYTRGMRIPMLIGRLSDGVRIPGGPYTLTQFLIGGLAVVLGYFTVGLWSGLLPSLLILSPDLVGTLLLLPMGLGVAKVAGVIPADVNPLHVASGFIRGAAPRRYGTQAGKPVAECPQPKRYRARVLTQGLLPETPASAPPLPAPAPSAAPQALARPAFHQRHEEGSVTQALLAAINT